MKQYRIKFHTGSVIKLQASYVKSTDTHYVFYNDRDEIVTSSWKWNSEVSEYENPPEIVSLAPLNFQKAGTSLPISSEKPRCA